MPGWPGLGRCRRRRLGWVPLAVRRHPPSRPLALVAHGAPIRAPVRGRQRPRRRWRAFRQYRPPYFRTHHPDQDRAASAATATREGGSVDRASQDGFEAARRSEGCPAPRAPPPDPPWPSAAAASSRSSTKPANPSGAIGASLRQPARRDQVRHDLLRTRRPPGPGARGRSRAGPWPCPAAPRCRARGPRRRRRRPDGDRPARRRDTAPDPRRPRPRPRCVGCRHPRSAAAAGRRAARTRPPDESVGCPAAFCSSDSRVTSTTRALALRRVGAAEAAADARVVVGGVDGGGDVGHERVASPGGVEHAAAPGDRPGSSGATRAAAWPTGARRPPGDRGRPRRRPPPSPPTGRTRRRRRAAPRRSHGPNGSDHGPAGMGPAGQEPHRRLHASTTTDSSGPGPAADGTSWPASREADGEVDRGVLGAADPQVVQVEQDPHVSRRPATRRRPPAAGDRPPPGAGRSVGTMLFQGSTPILGSKPQRKWARSEPMRCGVGLGLGHRPPASPSAG